MALPEGVLLGLGYPLLEIQASADKEFIEKYSLKEDEITEGEKIHLHMFNELAHNDTVKYVAGGDVQNAFRVFQWVIGSRKRAVFLGSIGDDFFGRTLRKKASASGLEIVYETNKWQKTATLGVLSYEKKRALCLDYAAAPMYVLGHLEKNENNSRIMKAQFFYVSGIILSSEPDCAMKIAEHALKTGKILIMNFSSTIVPKSHPAEIEAILPYVDILFATKEEAQEFEKSADLKDIALYLANYEKINANRPRTIVILHNGYPVFIVSEGQSKSFSIDKEKLPLDQIVDANGADDAFIGGFLAEYIRGKSLDDSIRCGCYATNIVLKHEGCTFPEVCGYK